VRHSNRDHDFESTYVYHALGEDLSLNYANITNNSNYHLHLEVCK